MRCRPSWSVIATSSLGLFHSVSKKKLNDLRKDYVFVHFYWEINCTLQKSLRTVQSPSAFHPSPATAAFSCLRLVILPGSGPSRPGHTHRALGPSDPQVYFLGKRTLSDITAVRRTHSGNFTLIEYSYLIYRETRRRNHEGKGRTRGQTHSVILIHFPASPTVTATSLTATFSWPRIHSNDTMPCVWSPRNYFIFMNPNTFFSTKYPPAWLKDAKNLVDIKVS